jgi:double-stranded uracil-DNA glycosylase
MRSHIQAESHVLPDVLAVGLRAVICGTAAGKRSGARGHYYADFRNRFWSVLYQVGLTTRQLSPSDFGSLSDFGLGLTDIAKAVSGVDASLAPADFDVPGFIASIRRCRPKIVAFNGKKAARVFYGLGRREPLEYGVGTPVSDFPRIFVLPSTSGSARRWWDVRPWKEFAKLMHEH